MFAFYSILIPQLSQVKWQLINPNIIYRIYKYGHGLRDAVRAYYITLSIYLTAGGCIRRNFNPCLSYKFVAKDLIIIQIRVDDIFVATFILQLIDEFKDYFRLKFQITFKGTIHTYLGVLHTLFDTNQLQLTRTKLLNLMFDELGISSTTPYDAAAIEYSSVADQMAYILPTNLNVTELRNARGNC